MAGQGVTTLGSREQCRQRCQNTGGCAHFTFFNNGNCHLHDQTASRQQVASATSGEPNCQQSNQQTNQGQSNGNQCYSDGSGYTPDMPGQGVSNSGSGEQCNQRCRNTAGCAHFTYFNNGNCHLHSQGATRSQVGAGYSGSPNCRQSNQAQSTNPNNPQTGFA